MFINKPQAEWHITTFLQQQSAVVPALDNSTGVRTVNLRGKFMLQIPSGNRFFGFKFVLPKEFPMNAP
jgi:hypothetical protein